MKMEVTYTIPEMTEEERALHRVQQAIDIFLPPAKWEVGSRVGDMLLRDVVMYGDAIRKAERLLADVRSNGT